MADQSFTFASVFGRAAETEDHAPGRVNLIGEHTDYSDGFVLPVALPRETVFQIARRTDHTVRAISHAFGPSDPCTYELGHEQRRHHWGDYLQGVTAVLNAAGHSLGGFDAFVTSDIPLGAGLSSSASFEVGALRALRRAFALELDDVPLARYGQRAENVL